MKKTIFITLCLSCAVVISCGKPANSASPGDSEGRGEPVTGVELAGRNMLRAMEIMDAAVPAYFKGREMLLSEYYNPWNGRVSGTGGSDASIWKYTAAIEAVNAILHGLIAHREAVNAALYDENFARYSELLAELFENADYYMGTYTLTSHTQTREWSVYAVPRGNAPEGANPGGDANRYNVYDDQMWFARELLEAYKATGRGDYLARAEYLAMYVLDGWDCTLDALGNEVGGIPWGPGYVTKHSCSHGPMVSPLVWLHELYRDKNDEITYLYIAPDGSRLSKTVRKGDYYLDFARRIYRWQNANLLRTDGVYYDMLGGCGRCVVTTERIGGESYRAAAALTDRVGNPLTYNSGAMLSGASDLYRATGEGRYLTDVKAQTGDSFEFFASERKTLPGYYGWPQSSSTWDPWFNGVLFRAYVDAWRVSCLAAQKGIDSFQKNLDYGYVNFLHEGFLPPDLLGGWSSAKADRRVNVMFTCSFVAQYATLARYELERE